LALGAEGRTTSGLDREPSSLPAEARGADANFLRLHWFDIGIVFAGVGATCLLVVRPTGLSLILWISLISLFVHQFEEYRFPGYFPGMINSVMFSSKQPDRYPLNTNTALVINVGVGWLAYFLAAVVGASALWLGIAAISISVGNFVAHTFPFNIKGGTIYNPGMVTATVLFVPIFVYFFYWITVNGAASPLDWAVGLALGAAFNYVGVLKLIDWLKDENTPYIFPARFLVPPK
jgi:hypothetical protein